MRIPLPLLLMTLTSAITNAGPLLHIEDLGTIGGSQISGMAINQSGQIAGYGTDVLGNRQAFTVTGSTPVMTTLGSGEAFGIAAGGQAVGNTYLNGNSQATLWSNGTAQNLSGLGGADSYAMAINSGQQVAGMATTAQGVGRAVVYGNGTTQDVSLPGAAWSAAYGINDGGAVAAYAMNSSGRFTAYTWSAAGGFQTLGTLGGTNSYAFGINSQGQIAGNSSTSSGYSHAFEWSSGAMRDLGTLGGNSSYAYGINWNGAIVGYSDLAGGSQPHAFVNVGGVMLDLNLLAENLGGWELTRAYAINDAGQITGTGVLDGVEHAFRLDPVTNSGASYPHDTAAPEPASAGTLLLGAAALFAAGSRWRIDLSKDRV